MHFPNSHHVYTSDKFGFLQKSQQLMRIKATPAIESDVQQQTNRPVQTQNRPNRTPTRRIRPSGGGY